jgi:hypothetical protein
MSLSSFSTKDFFRRVNKVPGPKERFLSVLPSLVKTLFASAMGILNSKDLNSSCPKSVPERWRQNRSVIREKYFILIFHGFCKDNKSLKICNYFSIGRIKREWLL